jgi:hypothetical protein
VPAPRIPGSRRRWILAAVLTLAVLAVAGAVGFAAAVSALEGHVAQALGPTSEMAALRVGWGGVVVDGLRIPGPKDWPTRDVLRAERVTLVPSLSSLLSRGPYRIRSITLTRPYLSALRSGGKLAVLPGIRRATEPGRADVLLDEIVLEDGVVEIFDATVATPPAVIRLEEIEAEVQDVAVPALSGRSRFELDGVLKGGGKEDGRAHVEGWAELATGDSSIATRLRSVDLAPFAPYLLRTGEAGARGRFDLDLDSEVRNQQLRAPGSITFYGLELTPTDGALSTFMGIPRSALLASLEEKGEKLRLDFTLEGDIANPEFSLNETLATKLTYALARTLGISIEGLVEGVGKLGVKGGQAAGEAAKGLGAAIREFFKTGDER